jgi:hypothetical protein
MRGSNPTTLIRYGWAAACLLLALVFMFGSGAVVSPLLLAVSAFMTWTRQFEEQAAKGKRVMGAKGRVITAALTAALAVFLLPGNAPKPSTTVAEGDKSGSNPEGQSEPLEASAEQNTEQINQTDAEMAASSSAPATAEPTPWSYRVHEDKVRGGKSYHAIAMSSNSFDLGWPYGDASLKLTVRKGPAFGTDLMFALTSGQLVCRPYDGCYATLRFDDSRAQRVRLSTASDYSRDVVFARDAARLIAQIKKARRLIVELEVYQHGRPQFEFDVTGLNFDH